MDSLDKETEKKKKKQDIIPDKYFSIGEVSKITHLPSYTLRFWESQFKQLHPQKSRGGHRRYQKKDVELILYIKSLLQEKKFTIKGAQEELKKKERENLLDPAFIKKELEEILEMLS